jgi:hypothetical protein
MGSFWDATALAWKPMIGPFAPMRADSSEDPAASSVPFKRNANWLATVSLTLVAVDDEKAVW